MSAIDTPEKAPVDEGTLYEHDFHAWTQQQAILARAGRHDALDLKNLAEELDSMGASDRRELSNRLKELLLHLLKWRYQAQRRSVSWEISIANQRDALHDLLAQSPSLKPRAAQVLDTAYVRARRNAGKETGLDETVFPKTCPFTLEQVLDSDYWPA